MARLTAEQWQEIRERREAGESLGHLATAYDVSKVTIFKRAKKEGWADGQDIEATIRRKFNEKANGMTNAVSAERRAEIIDAESERRVEVEQRHRQEWEQLEPFRRAAMAKMKDAHDAGTQATAPRQWTVAKVASEVAKNHIQALAAKQDAERKAYRLHDPTVSVNTATQIILEVPDRPYEPAR